MPEEQNQTASDLLRRRRATRNIVVLRISLVICSIISISLAAAVLYPTIGGRIVWRGPSFAASCDGGNLSVNWRSSSPISTSPPLQISNPDSADPIIMNFSEIQNWSTSLPRSQWSLAGITFKSSSTTQSTSNVWLAFKMSVLSIPLEYPAVLFAIITAVLLRRLLKLQRQRNNDFQLCTKCGYDLRASPERCPECGTARC